MKKDFLIWNTLNLSISKINKLAFDVLDVFYFEIQSCIKMRAHKIALGQLKLAFIYTNLAIIELIIIKI